MAPRTCRVCGRPVVLNSGEPGGARCARCIGGGTGSSGRPPRRGSLPPSGRVRSVGGRPVAVARLVRGLHSYWKRHRAPRPLGPRPLPPCQTCGQPVQQFHRGRCNPCYQYWYRTGQERPARLWRR